ncbi:MAG: hypothetical protein KAT48_13780 [Bacteroidales bacterium]|nr:hypothetical protein [Bacteroidales bacterium]
MKEKKTCFVVMPISTPVKLQEMYDGGPDHFALVYREVIKPAIERADLYPDPPFMSGTGFITQDIIEKLGSADYVLIDMSTQNANVFFEFGIRAAFNKPIILIKDTLTSLPSDIRFINTESYNPSLQADIVRGQIDIVTKHIYETIASGKEDNPIWASLGVLKIAEAIKTKDGDKYIVSQLNIQQSWLKQISNNVKIIQDQINSIVSLPREETISGATGSVKVFNYSDPFVMHPAPTGISGYSFDISDFPIVGQSYHVKVANDVFPIILAYGYYEKIRLDIDSITYSLTIHHNGQIPPQRRSNIISQIQLLYPSILSISYK